jgi:predicted alpha-1,6-mannanase (GH76 family)
MIKGIRTLFFALVLLCPILLQGQIVDPIAEKAYQGYLNAFLVRSNGQTYLVDGIAKRDKAYFWGQAFMITSLIDAYEENQSETRKQLIIDMINSFLIQETHDWSWNSWSDDIAWACIAMSRAYQITGNETYKTVAVNNWKFGFERGWDNFLGGGVWENMDKHTKAALSNNPMIISGMTLYETTGDAYFLNNSKRIYEWFRNSGIYNPTTGVVNEAKVNDGTIQYSDHPYNTGSFINAAATLYKHTKIASYLSDAQRAADHVVSAFPILTEEGDGAIRGIAKLARENGLEWKYYPWLLKQCENAWKNRRTDYNITNNNWTTKTGNVEQFAMQCVSALTVQMVTPEVQSIADTIDAENYNYKSGIRIEEITAGGKTAHFSVAGDWVEYIIDVPKMEIFTITYRVAGIGADTLLVQQDGVTIDSVFLPGTGDMQTYTTVSSPVKLKAGIHPIKLISVSGGLNIDKWVANSCLDITPSFSLNDGVAQQTAFATVTAGDKITFSPTPIDGTWSWNGPDNYTSTVREITILNIPLAQGGVYSASYVSPDGCVNFQDFMVTFSNCTPIPIVPYIQINSGVLQKINAVTLSAGDDLVIDPQAGNGTWSWSGPNGFTSDTKKVSFASIGYKQAGEYTVTYYNTNGCKSTKAFTVTLTGTEPCGSPITPYINAGNGWQKINYAILDAGASVEFGPQANKDNNWNWIGPNGFTATSRSFTITNFNASKAGYYTATVTNSAGCKSTQKFVLGLNGCNSTSIIPTITFNETPWAKTDSVTLASGGNISIELPVNASDGFLTWSGPYGFSSDSSKITINNIQNWEEGKYKAIYFNAEGCGSNHSIEIVINGNDNCGTAITPYLQVNGGSWNNTNIATLNTGGKINIGPHPLSGDWVWTGPDGFTSTERQITLSNVSVKQAGVYSVKHVNTSGCWSFNNFVITITNATGISSNLTNGNHEICLYPNPVTDIATLTNIPANTAITVFNLSGQSVLQMKSTVENGDVKLNVSSLKYGVYLVKIENKERKTLKLLKL